MVKIKLIVPIVYLLVFFGLNQKLFSQNTKEDTVYLTFNNFYKQVLSNHPLAKKANLLPQIAQQELRTARGNFDPSFNANIDGKLNKNQTIYQYVEPQIIIPTLIGVDVKAGIDQSDGVLINPEKAKYNGTNGQVPNQNYQLWYAGFSIPVIRGLVTDVRRTQLNLAKLFVQLNEAEQIKELNSLFLNATEEYWNWQQAYERYAIMKENRDLAERRLQIVISRIIGGEEKPIDSVEAIIEFQRRDVMLAEAELFFLNKSVSLSNYLWDENENPVLLKNNIVPTQAGSEQVDFTADSLAVLVSYAQQFHPQMQLLNVKVNQLSVERKLAIEFLKPQLNLEYYPFMSQTNGVNDNLTNIFTQNYKYGLTFSSSLLLRKERGKIQSTTFKLRRSNLDLVQGKRELANNVFTVYNELNNMQRLYNIQFNLTKNYTLLRDAEQFRFENGESSLFLVNQRERNLIEAEAKLVEIRAKYAYLKYKLQWASGIKLFN